MRSGSKVIAIAVLGSIAAALRAEVPTSPITPEAAVAAWCAVWTIEDPSERRASIARFWADDGVYSDPNVTTTPGAAGLEDAVLGFQHDFPGVRFRCGVPQVHHGLVRHAWIAVNPDGSVRWRGTEFSELAADGRIRRVVSFFGDAPAVSSEAPPARPSPAR